MRKYYNQMYDNVRELIYSFINAHKNLEIVKELAFLSDKSPEERFESLSAMHGFIGFGYEDWLNLVDLEWDDFHASQPIYKFGTQGIIIDNKTHNKLTEPTSEKQSWTTFKKQVLQKQIKLSKEELSSFTTDTLNILHNISTETNDPLEPIKGLVMGKVQSGKTTNMMGLMSMASDVGFNIFIILSGTTESLRIQNESRMEEVFNGIRGNRGWKLVPRPENRAGRSLGATFSEENNYYSVVLKNSSRLRKLNQWLNSDQKLKKRLRVIIIDDEFDQASVNTSPNPIEERKTINRLIVNLIHNKNIYGEDYKEGFVSMNYVCYTATPYANILSETPDNQLSLYPKSFISVLSDTNKYLGLKEFFGSSEDENQLNYIREADDVKVIRDFFEKNNTNLPYKLKVAICYFIGASASLRHQKKPSPVSMLIHVSNRIIHHDFLADKINEWITNNQDEIVRLVEKVWEKERDVIDIKELKKYVVLNEKSMFKQIPFYKIEQEVRSIISKLGPIKIDENGVHRYHDGIHLVVDHSGQNIEHRLSYPIKASDNSKTPVFLIIGGSTLSRGLTIEGLVSTYFLRTPSAADTLTQMARWLGYRQNYEIYPRVWMSDKTKLQFEYINTLEEELREHFRQLFNLGIDFSKIGPKIRHSPQYINITSRPKSRDATVAKYNFAGFTTQTYLFDKDDKIQKENVELTENFIETLGHPIIEKDKQIDKVFWRKIPFNKIKKKLLLNFKFNDRTKALSNIDYLIEWIEEKTKEGDLDDWNVILGGKGKINKPGNDWEFSSFTYNKINRTNKAKLKDDFINIGVLRSPRDIYGDITMEMIDNSGSFGIKEKIDKSIKAGNNDDYHEIRRVMGLEKTPQLIIYKIDKNSKPRISKTSPQRNVLDIDSDIIGLYILIPQKDYKNIYSDYVTVKIDNKANILDEEDIEYED